MNEQTQVVVDSYMKDLKRELRALPRDRRREILEDIEGHIDQSLGRNGTATEADARTLVDQLGDPSEIASEARERFGIPTTTFGAKEVVALILLVMGGALYLVGWIVGVALLWWSNAWTPREKWIGTLVPPGGFSTAWFLALMLSASDDTRGDVLATAVPILFILLGIAVPIWLGVKGYRRAGKGERA